jgi:hypothetical protein
VISKMLYRNYMEAEIIIAVLKSLFAEYLVPVMKPALSCMSLFS